MFDSILFVQLGSPEDASPKSVEKYLVEFLGDRHTLGNPPFYWNWLLRHIIAPKRSVKSAKKYQDLIDRAGVGEMPLLYYTRLFVKGIAQAVGSQIAVRYAFEFGAKPLIADALQELSDLGKKDIRVIPLYPQRSMVTTVAVYDLAKAAFEKYPELRMHFIDGFPQNEVWLEETLQEILKVWDKKCPIIFSFHGTPQNWVASGDPYSLDCEAEVDWFRRKLTAMNPDARIYITYQSRFGPVKWLGPYSTALAEEFGQKHDDLLVVCPSFMVDNLETIFEIDVELKDVFEKAGGKSFKRVPCLNANPHWVERFAKEVVREDLKGER